MRSSERSTTASTDNYWQAEAARVNEQLREAHRHKDEFVATLAHELRNPLAPILTSVELIRLRNPDDDAVRRATAIIQRQTIHLTRLVDDLLDVSRLTMGTPSACTVKM